MKAFVYVAAATLGRPGLYPVVCSCVLAAALR
jgi:hypothetical protein